jgi:hypothetical protein
MAKKPADLRELAEAIGDQSIMGPEPLGVDLNSGVPIKRNPFDLTFSSRMISRLHSDRVPPWWKPERDKFLWQTVFGSDVMSSAIFSTCARLVSSPVYIRPRDNDNKSHRRIAMWSELLLQYYWPEVAYQFAMDWQTLDNGAFMEVCGAGDADKKLEPTQIPGTNDWVYGTGLRILDSHNCIRTSDDEFPVVYRHRERNSKGEIVIKYYKFHHTRIIFSSQMPSTQSGMHKVGFSGASRCIHNVLRLDDIRILEDEVLGVRPATQLVFGKAITAEDMEKAFIVAETKAQSSDTNKRSGYAVFIGITGNAEQVKAGSMEFFDLKKFPEGYSPETHLNLAMNVIAMALGFDAREFWPATVRGATRADAEVQDRKSRAKTAGIWAAMIQNELNKKWAPQVAYATFDAPDLEMDALKATVAETRSRQRGSDKREGILDNRIIWQQMLASGEIDEEQYKDLIGRIDEIKSQAELAREAAIESANAPEQGGDSDSDGADDTDDADA